jgi:hypothetical protein
MSQFTTDPFVFEYEGETLRIRHQSAGQFIVSNESGPVAMFDAADTLRGMALDALEDDV